MTTKIEDIIFSPLLRREMAYQARKPQKGRWTYPGPFWAVVFIVVPLLLYVMAWIFLTEEPKLPGLWFSQQQKTVFFTLYLTTVGLELWLIGLRCGLYTAASTAEETNLNFHSVMLTSPVGLFQVFATKLAAAVMPYWAELIISWPLLLLFYTILGPVPWFTSLTILLFSMAASIFFAALGLFLGTTGLGPKKIARSYRSLFVFSVGFGCLSFMFQAETIFIFTVLAWLLIWLPDYCPRLVSAASILALIILTLIPIIGKDKASELLEFPDFLALNPIVNIQRSVPTDQKNPFCVLDRTEDKSFANFMHSLIEKELKMEIIKALYFNKDGKNAYGEPFDAYKYRIPIHGTNDTVASFLRTHPQYLDMIYQKYNFYRVQQMAMVSLIYLVAAALFMLLGIARIKKGFCDSL